MHTLNRHILTKLIAPVLVAALLLASCTTGPATKDSRYDFPRESQASRTLDSWFVAGGAEVDYRAPLDKKAPIEQVFALAEVAYWDGDVERAGELYLRMLAREPAHALNRFATSRLYALRDEMVDFHRRLEPVLAGIELGQVEPLTATYLSLIGQQVSWHEWDISDSEAEFAPDEIGFPSRWMTTPMMSPWRLRDFDRAFAVEEQASLADEYLSPQIAEDLPINYERSKPYIAGGMNLSPGFDRSGVHYMETFATVNAESDDGKAREFWLYTSFSGLAKVFIDGEEVISRTEGDYGTSKRLRRIALSPGEHRILVKLAYQRGYRDWFDFALLADDATALGGSGVVFSERPTPGAAPAKITLVSEQKRPSQLEPLLVAPNEVAEASDTALFLTASAAYMDLESGRFDAAFTELMARHENFAPGYILRAKQTQTLWEVPSRIRDSRTLANIRRASKLAPDNIDVAVRLIERLRAQGSSDREIRELIENARTLARKDGVLRNVEPLVEWADWLSDQGWSEAAEKAWKEVVEVAPSNCRAAGELQQLYYRRSHYPGLDTITAAHERCPSLAETLALERDDLPEERLAMYRKRAKRYPYNPGAQSNYADELIAQGRLGEAKKLLTSARDRMPWALGLWNKLADQALAEEGKDEALAILQRAVDENGSSGWLQWRMSALDNTIPLEEVMPDGLAAARAELKRATAQGEDYASDEAYYVVDFAARKYFEDGSSVTLTHNLVRVLTKNAIDRFGEFSAPGDARLIRARTIKADGTTRVPQETTGKSTLSMPGLAPGDFVEMAYVQYSPPEPLSKTQREGIRFFFRMGDISSLHSEYLVLGTDGEFMRINDAPEVEKIDTPVGKGTRFVRTDSPRPRNEPATVPAAEFLPWVQLHRRGTQIDTFEASRRDRFEQIRDSSKMSRQLQTQIKKWRKGLEPGSNQEVKELFYRVASWFPDPSMTAFGKDASHALMERDGSPLLVLKAAYDTAGIDSEIYLVKNKFQAPTEYAIGEFGKYRSALLRVQMPGNQHSVDKTIWVSPAGPDAMFGAVGLASMGQPAVCVSCEQSNVQTIPEQGQRPSTRTVDISGDLGADGTLTGEMTMTYNGVRAFVVRSSLRQRSDPSNRKKYIDLMISNLLSGASLQNFEIVGEDIPDEPLVITAKFERQNFAREISPGTLQVETPLFREPVASSYAELSTRRTPMAVRYQRDHDYSFHVKLPDGFEASLRGGGGDLEIDSEWGSFTRSSGIAQGALSITASIDMPIQRVSPQNYKDFRQWAIASERSSLLFLTLQKKR
jgi:tetratricopeptide (TPR) repeat protein